MSASRLLALLFGIAVIIALCGLRAADPFAVHAVRELGFDQLQRLKPRPASDAPVRVVDIDEAALAAYGQWPWPRDRLARLAERLEELGRRSWCSTSPLPSPTGCRRRASPASSTSGRPAAMPPGNLPA